MRHLRRWIPWLLVAAFFFIAISRFGEFEHLLATLITGQWNWVLVAALLQLAYFWAYAGIYRAAFDTVGVRSRQRSLFPVVIAAVFVNVAAPSAGASGAVLFVDDAKLRGESGPRAMMGTMLTLAADYVAFIPILLLGMGYLFSRRDLNWLEVFSAVWLFAMLLGLSSAMLLGLWRPALLQRLLRELERGVNGLARRFKRSRYLPYGWAETYSAEFTGAAAAITARPGDSVRTLLWALSIHVIDMFCLLAVALAFNEPLYPGVLVAGYAMCRLFWIASVTPQGIGFVEAMMTLTFTSLGVSVEHATVISLAFRGLSFWLPFGLGFLMMKRLPAFKSPVSGRPAEARPVRTPGMERPADETRIVEE